MRHLIFTTEAQAEKAQRRVLKIWSYFLKQEKGYDVGSDDVVNTGFRGGRKVAAVTTRWDTPRELEDGTWAVGAPDITTAKMRTIPKAKRERFGITKATTAADILGAAFTVTSKPAFKDDGGI